MPLIILGVCHLFHAAKWIGRSHLSLIRTCPWEAKAAAGRWAIIQPSNMMSQATLKATHKMKMISTEQPRNRTLQHGEHVNQRMFQDFHEEHPAWHPLRTRTPLIDGSHSHIYIIYIGWYRLFGWCFWLIRTAARPGLAGEHQGPTIAENFAWAYKDYELTRTVHWPAMTWRIGTFASANRDWESTWRGCITLALTLQRLWVCARAAFSVGLQLCDEQPIRAIDAVWINRRERGPARLICWSLAGSLD